MQSFDLLALKLRPWCSNKAMDRHSFGVFLYIVRFENSSKSLILQPKYVYFQMQDICILAHKKYLLLLISPNHFQVIRITKRQWM